MGRSQLFYYARCQLQLFDLAFQHLVQGPLALQAFIAINATPAADREFPGIGSLYAASQGV